MNVQEYYYPEAGPSYSRPPATIPSPSRQQHQQQPLSLSDWDYYSSNANVSPSGSSIDTPISDASAVLSYPIIAGEQAVAPEYPAATYAEQQSWHTPPLVPVAQSKSSLSDALGSFNYERAPQPSQITSQAAGYYSGQYQYQHATYPMQPGQERSMAVSHTVRNHTLTTPTKVPSQQQYAQTQTPHHNYVVQRQIHHHSPPVRQQQSQSAYLPAQPSQSHPYASAHTQQPYTAQAHSHAHVPLVAPPEYTAQQYRTSPQHQLPTAAQAPLYHPKPQHPLPEWTKQPELVSDSGVTPGHVASAPAPARVDVHNDVRRHHTAYAQAASFQFGQASVAYEDDEMDDDDEYDGEYESEVSEVRQERTAPAQTGSLSGSSLLFQPISAAVQSRFAPKSAATSSTPAAPTAAPNVPAPTSQSQQYPMLPLGMSAPAYWA